MRAAPRKAEGEAGRGEAALACPGREGRGAGGTAGRSPAGPHHTAARVGVLGWFSRSVLHNQPAKSTSSTSDRLMKVWLCKGRGAGQEAQPTGAGQGGDATLLRRRSPASTTAVGPATLWGAERCPRPPPPRCPEHPCREAHKGLQTPPCVPWGQSRPWVRTSDLRREPLRQKVPDMSCLVRRP